MADSPSLVQLHDLFLQAEADLGLFEVTVRGVPFWEWVRFQTFHEVILVAKGLHEPPRRPGPRSAGQVAGILVRSLLDLAHNPYRAPSAEVVFVGHPRRKLREDGRWWDLYCDPLMAMFPSPPLCLEFLHGNRHCTPSKTTNIRYMELFSFHMRWRAWRFGRVLRGAEKAQLQDLERKLGEIFECPVDLCGLVEQYMKIRFCGRAAYRKLLQRIKPKIVFLVVSYGREVLVAACKELRIPVVELQHGTIGPQHCAYAYPPGRTKHTFPDYFFTWGNYWKKRISFPLPSDRVQVIGYPFLELEKQAAGNPVKKNRLVFVSQPTIGPALSRLAMETRQVLAPSIPIIFKLHPGEYTYWREKYPGLLHSGVLVIDHDKTSLNRLLAESTILVGVYSTAVLEGLALGCRVLLADLPGVETYADLLEAGAATRVRTAEDIRGAAMRAPVCTEPYFQSGWRGAFTEALRQIGLSNILKMDEGL